MQRLNLELPPSTREPGRRGKQGETRARLIQVAIELVRREGLPALTTSRITRAAGIAQPGFYAHFKNVNDIVGCAVTQIADDVRESFAAVRKRASTRIRDAGNVASLETMRIIVGDSLRVFVADANFAELFLRYRRDPSLLGGLMRVAGERARDDLTKDLWRSTSLLGFKPDQFPLVMMWADQILALYFSAAEGLFDGRYQSQEVVIESMARSCFAIMRATLHAAGLGHLVAMLGPESEPPTPRVSPS